MERSYDDNLTFQPTINKQRIDAACKKVSTSLMKKHKRTSQSLKRSTSVVSSVESERGGVTQDKNVKLLGEKLDRDLQLACSKVIQGDETPQAAQYPKENMFKVLDEMMYLNTKIGSPIDQREGLVEMIWAKFVGK